MEQTIQTYLSHLRKMVEMNMDERWGTFIFVFYKWKSSKHIYNFDYILYGFELLKKIVLPPPHPIFILNFSN